MGDLGSQSPRVDRIAGGPGRLSVRSADARRRLIAAPRRRARLRAVIVVFAAAAVLLRGAPAAVAQAAPPKLVVLLVVDQMRADYVDRFSPDWTGGLKRLVTEGAWFRRAAYPYLITVTCAGHATIATGAFPHTHGVVQNDWPAPDRRSAAPCDADPLAFEISAGRPTQPGHSARQLMVPTLADEMRARLGSRVVSLSAKDDAAIMLAGHGGDAVAWLNASLTGLATSSAFGTEALSARSRFTQANPIDADLTRSWDRLLPADRYHEPDAGAGEVAPPGWTTTFPHVFAGRLGRADTDFRVRWLHSPFVDDYIGRAAETFAGTAQLGVRNTTDVLAISFSGTDEVGHIFGPDSQEIQDTLARLDRTLGRLFDRLDATVGRNRYVVALSADHGVTSIPERARADGRDGGRIDPDLVVDRVEARLTTAWGRRQYVAWLSGTTMNLYFVPGVYERLVATPAVLDDVVRTIQQVPGIARVLRADQVKGADASTDRLVRAAALSYYPGRSGDLIFALKPGWNMSGNPAMHGSANPDDQQVPLFLIGPGIKAGQYQQPATPADLAPTLAALAGITLPKAEGRVLREALR